MMNEWRRLKVKLYFERLIGFSIPQKGEVLVISRNEVLRLRLGSEITVKTDELDGYDIYDSDLNVANYSGNEYQIIDLDGNGNPVLESPTGEKLVIDQDSETLSVRQKGVTVFSMKYENFAGSRAAATFSPDGRYIVLGCPYDFDFLILERENAA